jgi:hypothetical protein
VVAVEVVYIEEMRYCSRVPRLAWSMAMGLGLIVAGDAFLATTASAAIPDWPQTLRSPAAAAELHARTFKVKSRDGRFAISGPKAALPRGVAAKKLKLVKVPSKHVKGAPGAYRLLPLNVRFKRPVTFSLTVPTPGQKRAPASGDASAGMVMLFESSRKTVRPVSYDNDGVSINARRGTTTLSLKRKRGFKTIFWLWGVGTGTISDPGDQFLESPFDVVATVKANPKFKKFVRIKGDKPKEITIRKPKFALWGELFTFVKLKSPPLAKDRSVELAGGVQSTRRQTATIEGTFRCKSQADVTDIGASATIIWEVTTRAANVRNSTKKFSLGAAVLLQTPNFACKVHNTVDDTGGGVAPQPPMLKPLVAAWEHPTAIAPSYICVLVEGTPGATVGATATKTDGGIAFDNTGDGTPESATATRTALIGADGTVVIVWAIYAAGKYDFSVTATDAGGQTVTDLKNFDVPGPVSPPEKSGPFDCVL